MLTLYLLYVMALYFTDSPVQDMHRYKMADICEV
jgi:hypothetical protein